MRGTIISSEVCPICGGKYQYNGRDIFCPNHPKQRPSRSFIVRFTGGIFHRHKSFDAAEQDLYHLRRERGLRKGLWNAADYKSGRPNSFGALAEEYIKRKQASCRAPRKIIAIIARAAACFGDRNLRDITGGELDDFLFNLTYEAIQEPASPDTHARYARGRSDNHKWADGGPGNQTIAKSFDHMRKPGVNPKAAENSPGCRQNASFSAAVKDIVEWRNKRTVWKVAPQPFPEAHFATFPEALVRPCIMAGCPEGGIVFDPFVGSGTVAVVAEALGCDWLGCEMSPAYIEMAERRIAGSNRQNRMFVR